MSDYLHFRRRIYSIFVGVLLCVTVIEVIAFTQIHQVKAQVRTGNKMIEAKIDTVLTILKK